MFEERVFVATHHVDYVFISVGQIDEDVVKSIGAAGRALKSGRVMQRRAALLSRFVIIIRGNKGKKLVTLSLSSTNSGNESISHFMTSSWFAMTDLCMGLWP